MKTTQDHGPVEQPPRIGIGKDRNPVLGQEGRQHHAPDIGQRAPGKKGDVDGGDGKLDRHVLDRVEQPDHNAQRAQRIGHRHGKQRRREPHEETENEEGHLLPVALRRFLDAADHKAGHYPAAIDVNGSQMPDHQQRRAPQEHLDIGHDPAVRAGGPQDIGNFVQRIGQGFHPFAQRFAKAQHLGLGLHQNRHARHRILGDIRVFVSLGFCHGAVGIDDHDRQPVFGGQAHDFGQGRVLACLDALLCLGGDGSTQKAHRDHKRRQQTHQQHVHVCRPRTHLFGKSYTKRGLKRNHAGQAARRCGSRIGASYVFSKQANLTRRERGGPGMVQSAIHHIGASCAVVDTVALRANANPV